MAKKAPPDVIDASAGSGDKAARKAIKKAKKKAEKKVAKKALKEAAEKVARKAAKKAAKKATKKAAGATGAAAPVAAAAAAPAAGPAAGGGMETFESTPFEPAVKAKLAGAGFPTPTPIQAQSWPAALAGSDLIAVAKTGSGKTLAFLLPAFHLFSQPATLQEKTGRPAPRGLVMAPTRELAVQIQAECEKFCPAHCASCCVYGGVPIPAQQAALKQVGPSPRPHPALRPRRAALHQGAPRRPMHHAMRRTPDAVGRCGTGLQESGGGRRHPWPASRASGFLS
jgi:hypothetical protein